MCSMHIYKCFLAFYMPSLWFKTSAFLCALAHNNEAEQFEAEALPVLPAESNATNVGQKRKQNNTSTFNPVIS